MRNLARGRHLSAALLLTGIACSPDHTLTTSQLSDSNLSFPSEPYPDDGSGNTPTGPGTTAQLTDSTAETTNEPTTATASTSVTSVTTEDTSGSGPTSVTTSDTGDTGSTTVPVGETSDTGPMTTMTTMTTVTTADDTTTTSDDTTTTSDDTTTTSDDTTTGPPPASCGNGKVDPGEQCDDANDNYADTCWPTCEKSQCGTCGSPRANLLFIVDYSTSMNNVWVQGTRYENLTANLAALMTTEPSLLQRSNVALMRFGHDPSPNPGTKIQNETTGITDGQKLDLAWTANNKYVVCQHEKLAATITDIIPPMNGNLVGIGTWTKGALDFALTTIKAQRALFGENQASAPFYRVILITDGKWTSQNGTMQLQPPTDNPAPSAANLFNAGVSTHVIAIGEAVNLPFTDEIAAAGGTGSARDVATPAALMGAFQAVLGEIEDDGVVPANCKG